MNADALVTFNGPKNTCEVALRGSVSAQAMPSGEVVPYLVDEVKLPKGALFDIVTIPNVNVAEYEQVMAALKAAGYKRVPGIHVGFLTEPGHDR
jgi:hypothetical protein